MAHRLNPVGSFLPLDIEGYRGSLNRKLVVTASNSTPSIEVLRFTMRLGERSHLELCAAENFHKGAFRGTEERR